MDHYVRNCNQRFQRRGQTVAKDVMHGFEKYKCKTMTSTWKASNPTLLELSTSPLTLLERRAEPTAAPLLAATRALVAGQPLTYVGSFRNERTRLPVRLSVKGEPVDFVFERIGPSFRADRLTIKSKWS